MPESEDVPGAATTITVSVPEDVAERLAKLTDVSAYVTGAVRRAMRTDETRETLRQAGFNITDEGVERMRQRLLRHPLTPEVFAAARAKLDRIAAGDLS